jgi:hypothetical protein
MADRLFQGEIGRGVRCRHLSKFQIDVSFLEAL